MTPAKQQPAIPSDPLRRKEPLRGPAPVSSSPHNNEGTNTENMKMPSRKKLARFCLCKHLEPYRDRQGYIKLDTGHYQNRFR